MKPITIGKAIESGARVKIDPKRLVTTRALVTANSGGGKSWLLRLLFEQLGTASQLIVLDREGEFVTLREKLDLVLVGPQGEIPTDVRSAGLLVRRLMEKSLSAVVDMSDLTLRLQRQYVRLFLTSLMELPKDLWQPCFIGLDETHLFAPEKGSGEAESTDAVINLATLGRKRGYGSIFATQRISKFHKDAAAEQLNKFIGRTTLDVDQKRAADELGITKDEGRALRELSPPGSEGEFYCFGPALEHSGGVVKMRVGEVETTHPQAGQGRVIAPPKPSSSIVAVLAELTDLPQQAEAEAKDMAAAKLRIAKLEAQLKANGAGLIGLDESGRPLQKLIEVPSRRDAELIRRLREGLKDAMKVIAKIESQGFEGTGLDPEQIKKAVSAAADQIVKMAEARLVAKTRELETLKKEALGTLTRLQKLLVDEKIDVSVSVKHNPPFELAPGRAPSPAERTYSAPDAEGRAALSPTERDVIDAAATFPGGATRQRISIFTGRSIKSSSFQQCFSGGEAKNDNPSLVQRGLLRLVEGDRYAVTEEGAAVAQARSGVSLADWLAKLTPTEADVLKCLAESHMVRRLTREDVSAVTKRSIKSSSFQSAFPALRDLGLIEGDADFAITPALVEA